MIMLHIIEIRRKLAYVEERFSVMFYSKIKFISPMCWLDRKDICKPDSR